MKLSYSVAAIFLTLGRSVFAADCVLNPLGDGQDDTSQILAAIDVCGTDGSITLNEGDFNITRKMTWNLTRSTVDLYGTLNFAPDIDYWLQENSTYRVVFIQSQASWFVVTGRHFVIDAHNQGESPVTRPEGQDAEIDFCLGGINGNGQPWWEYFTTVPRQDGDGRPLALWWFK
ncbi:unnamed protein product [Peniophora sp. CBMAI 1063]|nr:unnamed protein product [Peniophora sp. CBMAI 1063]